MGAARRVQCLSYPTAALALAIAMLPTSGLAAMRRCHKPIVTEGRDAHTELAARRNAVKAWMEAAAAVGPGYTRFDLAIGRRVACEQQPDGTHVCRAGGAPCTIEQNPKPPRGPGQDI